MLLENKLYKDALEAINSIPLARYDLRRLEIIAYCTEDLEEAGNVSDLILENDRENAAALNLKGIIAR